MINSVLISLYYPELSRRILQITGAVFNNFGTSILVVWIWLLFSFNTVRKWRNSGVTQWSIARSKKAKDASWNTWVSSKDLFLSFFHQEGGWTLGQVAQGSRISIFWNIQDPPRCSLKQPELIRTILKGGQTGLPQQDPPSLNNDSMFSLSVWLLLA